jgi:hypothetical protein
LLEDRDETQAVWLYSYGIAMELHHVSLISQALNPGSLTHK